MGVCNVNAGDICNSSGDISTLNAPTLVNSDGSTLITSITTGSTHQMKIQNYNPLLRYVINVDKGSVSSIDSNGLFTYTAPGSAVTDSIVIYYWFNNLRSKTSTYTITVKAADFVAGQTQFALDPNNLPSSYKVVASYTTNITTNAYMLGMDKNGNIYFSDDNIKIYKLNIDTDTVSVVYDFGSADYTYPIFDYPNNRIILISTTETNGVAYHSYKFLDLATNQISTILNKKGLAGSRTNTTYINQDKNGNFYLLASDDYNKWRLEMLDSDFNGTTVYDMSDYFQRDNGTLYFYGDNELWTPRAYSTAYINYFDLTTHEFSSPIFEKLGGKSSIAPQLLFDKNHNAIAFNGYDWNTGGTDGFYFLNFSNETYTLIPIYTTSGDKVVHLYARFSNYYYPPTDSNGCIYLIPNPYDGLNLVAGMVYKICPNT